MPTQQLPPALSGDIMHKNLSFQMFIILLLTGCLDDGGGCDEVQK